MTIGEAKFKILKKNPFFGTILYNLPVEETEELPTLGVDGEKLYVNMKFWETLNGRQQMGVLMHECGHLFLQHPWRGRFKTDMAVDPTTGQAVSVYNLAGDAVINLMIMKDTGMDLPNPFFDTKYDGWTTEEVYEDLIKKIPRMTEKQAKDFMDKFGSCDKSKWKDAKGSKAKEQQEKWSRIMREALQVSKNRGFEPGYLKRLFNEIDPQEDWRNVLLDYVQPFNNDYSFNPVDRRFLDSDFSLPDIADGEKIDWLAIAIDTSGSISSREMDKFLGEVKGIVEAYDKVKIKLTFCDAQASPFVELEGWEPGQIKPTGGGGTAFTPVFEMLKKEPIPPKALLYFTDGYGDEPLAPDNYDTIWVMTTEVRMKFGRNLPYKI